MIRLPKITAKQEGGDDGYQYVVRVNGHEFVNGLTRNEVPGYKRTALRIWMEGEKLDTTLLKEFSRREWSEGHAKAWRWLQNEINKPKEVTNAPESVRPE